eukprot:403371537
MPEDRARVIWNIINIILLLYTALIMPYKLAFRDNGEEDMTEYLEILIDALFSIDIIITFFSAIEADDGKITYNMKTIAKKYLKSFFFVDVIASFPFQLLIPAGQNNNYNKLLRLMRLPRFFRIVRVLKIMKNMKALKQNRYYRKIDKYMNLHQAIIRMAQGVIVCVILTHIFGCFWFMTSKFQDFEPDTWTVLTLGYGDIPAVTVPEMILAQIWMLLGVGFYSFVVGNYSSMISEQVIGEAYLLWKTKRIDEMGQRLKFPIQTQIQLTEFVKKNFRSLTMDSILRQDQAELFLSLPSNLKKEILQSLYSKIVEKVQFFREMEDKDFLWFLLPQLKQMKYDKDELIYKKGDPADIIYFIYKGSIRLYSQKGYCFQRYDEGDIFGESDTLFKYPRDSHAMSQTHVMLYMLKVDYAFLKASKEFEQNLKKMIREAKMKRLEHTTLMMTVDNPFIMKGNTRRQYKRSATFKTLKTMQTNKSQKTPLNKNKGASNSKNVERVDSFVTSYASDDSNMLNVKKNNKKKNDVKYESSKSASSSSSESGGPSPQSHSKSNISIDLPKKKKQSSKNLKKYKKQLNSSSDNQDDESSSSGLESLIFKAREEDQQIHKKQDDFFDDNISRKKVDLKKFILDTNRVMQSQSGNTEIKQTPSKHNQKNSHYNMKEQIQEQVKSHFLDIKNPNKAFRQHEQDSSSNQNDLLKNLYSGSNNHILQQNYNSTLSINFSVDLNNPLKLNQEIINNLKIEKSEKKQSKIYTQSNQKVVLKNLRAR